MIDWTDEFEILSLMGVEKGWDAVYITYFCDMGYHAWRDSAHATRSCRTRNQRVPQILESLPLLYPIQESKLSSIMSRLFSGLITLMCFQFLRNLWGRSRQAETRGYVNRLNFLGWEDLQIANFKQTRVSTQRLVLLLPCAPDASSSRIKGACKRESFPPNF
jgi:hypothetical protein